METLINEQIAQQVKEVFKELEHPVEIILFTLQGHQSSEYIQQLLDEICALSELLHLDIHDFDGDRERAAKNHLDKAPGFVLAGRDGTDILDFGIRFAGLPAQFEFSSLIYGIMTVSKRDSMLKPETRKSLAEIKNLIHLMVFVTPT